MRTEKDDGPVRPAVIKNAAGEILGWGLCNLKGYKKTIERNQPWILDGNTGRLLPRENASGYSGISDCGDHYEIIVESWSNPPGMTTGTNDTFSRVHGEAGSHSGSQVFSAEILSRLEALLRERKRSLPKGSYSSHLFSQGEEKIRKKTGEEAIELLLAGENSELAAEGADLIYHMMVLFVERGMSIADCLKILEERQN